MLLFTGLQVTLFNMEQAASNEARVAPAVRLQRLPRAGVQEQTQQLQPLDTLAPTTSSVSLALPGVATEDAAGCWQRSGARAVWRSVNAWWEDKESRSRKWVSRVQTAVKIASLIYLFIHTTVLEGQITDLTNRAAALNASLTNAAAAVSSVNVSLASLGPLLPNGDTSLRVFGSDPRWRGPDGLQRAYEWVKSHVISQPVTIYVEAGVHDVGSVTLAEFPLSKFVSIRGAAATPTSALPTTLRFLSLNGGDGFYIATDINLFQLNLIGPGEKNQPGCIHVELGATVNAHNLRCENWYYGIVSNSHATLLFNTFALARAERIFAITGTFIRVDFLTLEAGICTLFAWLPASAIFIASSSSNCTAVCVDGGTIADLSPGGHRCSSVP